MQVQVMETRSGHDGHHRQKEHRAKKHPTRDIAVHQNRQPKSEGGLYWDNDDHEPGVVEEAFPESSATQGVDVVVGSQTDVEGGIQRRREDGAAVEAERHVTGGRRR